MAAGTYLESITIDKSLTLRGGFTTSNWITSNPELNLTIIDAQGSGRVIYVNNANVVATVNGFHLTGGNSTDSPGAGVYNENGHLTLENNKIYGNNAVSGEGGGIVNGTSVNAATLILRGNDIYSNTADTGAGISIRLGTVTIEANRIFSNSAVSGVGGGVFISGNSNVTLKNNLIYNNTTSVNGGGVQIIGGNVTLENNTFYKNTAQLNGGGLLASGATVTMTNNLIISNTATTLNGGGILSFTTMSFAFNDFFGNSPNHLHNNSISINPTTIGTNNRISDPLFIDPTTFDLHLSSGSPAIDSGTATTSVTTDFEGQGRPFGSAIDRGADEYYPIGIPSHFEVTIPDDDVDLLEIFELVVTIQDVLSNTVAGYDGNVSLLTTGSGDGFPGIHTFLPADQGIYTFTNLSLKNAGTQTITVTDGILTETVSINVDDLMVVIDQDTMWDETAVVIAGTLVVTNGKTLTLKGSTAITAENILIADGATVSTNGKGYGASSGPGYTSGGYGAGHGGYGGGGGGQPYGSVFEPVDWGSGGSNKQYAVGGKGGGAIHLEVSGILTVDGQISANGTNAYNSHGPYSQGAGGGSGGSIWITAGTLTGSSNGRIQANGGHRVCGGQGCGVGGGAGGRIAISYTTNLFSPTGEKFEAFGGNSPYGGAGTIYLQSDNPQDKGTLIIDNGGNNGQSAALPEGNYEFDNIILTDYGHLKVIGTGSQITLASNITGNGTATLSSEGIINAPQDLNISDVTVAIQGDLTGPENINLTDSGGLILYANTPWHTGRYTFTNIVVGNNTQLTLLNYNDGDSNYTDDYGVTINAQNIFVEEGAAISADGLGYGTSSGPGYAGSGRGAGHGGYGGNGSGQPYGSVFEPVDLGSGGSQNQYAVGGKGGGAIGLQVSGILTVDGRISANGTNAYNASQSQYSQGAGGGSGGSIWITAGTLAGSNNGRIQANGGNRVCGGQGCGGSSSGAGGRIAISYTTNLFSPTGEKFEAFGGNSPYGGAGTIYLQSDNPQDKGTLIINNAGNNGQSAALVEEDYEFDSIILKDYGHLTVMSAASVITLTETGFSGDDTTTLTAQGNLIASSVFNIYSSTIDIQGQLIGAPDITIDNGGQLKLQAKAYPNGTLALNDLNLPDGTLTLASYDNNDGNNSNDDGFTLYANSIEVGANGLIEANGLGYLLNNGPGAHSSGASHGGYGGGNAATYGSVYEPMALGSSGNNGRGGGAIHLLVTNTLTLSGQLQTNGLSDGGGGSIWLQADTLTGDGQIEAKGGTAAGGGGRIVVDAATDNYGGSYNTDFGGGTCPIERLCDGTIYLNGVDPLVSTLELSPASVPANGVAAGTLTVTLKNQGGAVLIGQPVSVTLQTADNDSLNRTFINGQTASTDPINIGPTNALGVVTAVITSTKAETKTFDIAGGVVRLVTPGQIFFNPDVVEALASTVEAVGSGTATADGSETINIEITAKDKQGNLVENIATSLTTEPAVTLVPLNPTTDQAGIARYQISHDTPGPVVVSATLLPAGGNPVAVVDTATITFTGPDLQVSLVGLYEVTAQYPFTSTLTVVNQGSLTATGVLITDTLPTGFTFARQQSNGDSFNQVGTDLIWTTSELGPAESLDITLVLTVDAGLTAGQQLTNIVTATTTAIELNQTNNEATALHSVRLPRPQLTLSPGGPTLSVSGGQSTQTNLTLKNSGQLVMTGLVVSAPTVIPWVSLTPPTGGLPDLQPGQQTVVTVTAAPDTSILAGAYRDFVIAVDANGNEQRAILTVNKQPITRTLQASIDNDVGQTVADAYLGLLQTDALVDVTPAFTNYVDVAAEGTTNTSGQLTLPNLPVGTYDYTLSAPNHDAQNGTLTIVEGSGLQDEQLTLTANPQLKVSPLAPTLAISAGGTTVREITIVNTGAAPLTDITITPPSDYPWIYMGTPPSAAVTLAPGEELNLSLFASPPTTLTNGLYTDNTMMVNAAGQTSQPVNVAVQVTAQATRDVELIVTSDSDQPLAGASVSLVRQDASIQSSGGVTTTFNEHFTGRTDSSGLAIFDDLPLGSYTYIADKPGFKQKSGTFQAQLSSSGAVAQRSEGGLLAYAPNLPISNRFFRLRQSHNLDSSSPFYYSSAAIPHLQSSQQVPIQLDAAPFDYEWSVAPVAGTGGQTFDIELTITQDNDASGLSLFVPGRQWIFAKCDGDVLIDSIRLHNPSQSVMTLTEVSISVPGVNTTILNVPGQIPPGKSRFIEVRGTLVQSTSLAQGHISLAGKYRAVDNNPVAFVFNPSSYSSDPIPPGQLLEKLYTLTPFLFNAGASYSLTIVQPPLLNWINLQATSNNPLPEVDVTLQMTPPDWLAIGETYTDRAILKVAGSDGKSRAGYLNLTVTRRPNGVDLHTAFELAPLDEIEYPLEAEGLINTHYDLCEGSSGGGGSSTGGGAGGGYSWSTQSDGSLKGTKQAGGGGGSGGGSGGGNTGASGPPPQITGDTSQQVEMELGQQVVIGGGSDSTRASLTLSNRFPDQSIDNLVITLIIRDADGNDVTSQFTIEPPPPLNLGTLGGGGQALGDWVIRPNFPVTSSQTFEVQARIDYVFLGVARTFLTLPQPLTVLAAPEIIIDYELPEAGLSCTIFDLRATIRNVGAGPARGFSLSSGQPQIVAQNGQLQGFQIIDVALDGQPLPTLAMNVQVGDIAPGTSREIVWRMQSPQPGRFIEFTSDFRMLSYDGKYLAPQLREINTFFAPPDDLFLYGCETETFYVSGWVRDETGNLVPDLSEITFLVNSGGSTTTVQSALNLSGTYTLSSLEAGSYVIEPAEISVLPSGPILPEFSEAKIVYAASPEQFTVSIPPSAQQQDLTVKSVVEIVTPISGTEITNSITPTVKAKNRLGSRALHSILLAVVYHDQLVDGYPYQEVLSLELDQYLGDETQLKLANWSPTTIGRVSLTAMAEYLDSQSSAAYALSLPLEIMVECPDLPELSYIGEAVSTIVSPVECGSTLPDDWFITMPPTEQAIVRFGDLAREAKYEVDITTYLWEYESSATDLFLSGVKDLYEVVKDDAENNNSQDYPEGMTIRILLGAYEAKFVSPFRRQFEDQRIVVLDELTDHQIPVEEGGYWKIEVGVHPNVDVWFGGGNTGNIYSHIKMMTIDGQKAIVAGYNMISDAAGFFDGTYDVGAKVEGGGIGQETLNVFDRLWLGATLCTEIVTLPQGLRLCSNETVSSISHTDEVSFMRRPIDTVVNLFSLYRDEVDKSADEAIKKALSASTEKVNIFQNRVLHDPDKEILPYVTGIANALQNNSYVRILNANNIVEASLNTDGFNAIKDYISGMSPDLLQNLERRGFVPNPNLPWWKLEPIPGVHAKTFSVDGEFLVIGSQNFDYSAFGNTPEDEDLAEYSIGVDDETAANSFDIYFDNLWNNHSIGIVQADGLLQDAVAQAEPNAIVLVPEGVYNETVTIDKPITILGQSTDGTIIEPPAGQPAFNITSSEVAIYNLTAQNSAGYAIELIDSSPNSLKDIFIRKVLFNNNALGGVLVEGLIPGSPVSYVVENNTFIGGQYGIQINVLEEQAISSTVRNNIFFGQSIAPIKISSATDGGVVYGYNLFNTCDQASGGGCSGDWYEGMLNSSSQTYNNLLDVDPNFNNPILDDYRLLPDSPAIDAGDPATINEQGRDGHIPLRADIGAFEMELVLDSPTAPFQETGGQVVMDVEHFAQHLRPGNRVWVEQTDLAGYAGPGYLGALPDTDLQFTTAYTTTSPELRYTINFTTTGVYIIWLRGYASNSAGDSLYVSIDDQPATTLTGFAPRKWDWANKAANGGTVTIEIAQPGVHTLHLWQREDGLRLDRIVLTTDGSYIPTEKGLVESERASTMTP